MSEPEVLEENQDVEMEEPEEPAEPVELAQPPVEGNIGDGPMYVPRKT